ncbi:MSCRAMM family protein [Vagococcus sp.]|uniref:MSCRAMM family protein n=1 Tax=Vagococcus sp. TaxID=1933889 RepID=UPI003F956DC3
MKNKKQIKLLIGVLVLFIISFCSLNVVKAEKIEQDDLSTLKQAKVISNRDKNLIIDVVASKDQPYLKIPSSYLKNKDKVTFKGIKNSQKISILIDNSQKSIEKLLINFQVDAIGLSKVEMGRQLSWIFVSNLEEKLVFKSELPGKISLVDIPKMTSDKKEKNHQVQEITENKEDLISNKNSLNALELNEDKKVTRFGNKLPVQKEESLVNIVSSHEEETEDIDRPSTSSDGTEETANPDKDENTSSSDGQENPGGSLPNETVGESVVTIYCIDIEDENVRLAGAVFTIFDANHTIVQDDVTTSEDGYIVSKKLKEGNYYIKQKKAPQGYLFDEDKKYDFRIKSSSMQQIYVENKLDDSSVPGEKPQDTDFGAIMIVKVNEKNTEERLAGATFAIYKESGELYEDEEIVTNSEGESLLLDLPFGNYYLIETKAPQGYRLNSEKHYFTIDENNKSSKLEQIVVMGLKETDSTDASSANSGPTGKTSTTFLESDGTATTETPSISSGATNRKSPSRSQGEYYQVSNGDQSQQQTPGTIKYLPQTNEEDETGMVVAGLIVFTIVSLISYGRFLKN